MNKKYSLVKENLIPFGIGCITGFMIIFWGILIRTEIMMSETPNIVVREYGKLALTLFGFTLIGGIFERGRKENKLSVERYMFMISLVFLLSATSFLLSSTLYGKEITPELYVDICNIGCGIGIVAFIIATISLMVVLIRHFLATS